MAIDQDLLDVNLIHLQGNLTGRIAQVRDSLSTAQSLDYRETLLAYVDILHQCLAVVVNGRSQAAQPRGDKQ